MKRFRKKTKKSDSYKVPLNENAQHKPLNQEGIFSHKGEHKTELYGSFKPKRRSNAQSLDHLKQNLRQKRPFYSTSSEEKNTPNEDNHFRESANDLAQAMRDALYEGSHLPYSYETSFDDYEDQEYHYTISQGGIIYGDETGTHHCPHIKPFYDEED